VAGKIIARDAQNLSKIVAALRGSPGGLWIREIARSAKIHVETARRLIRKYPFLFEEYADFTQYKVRLKLIRLKRTDVDVSSPENLQRYLKMARELA